MSDHGTAEPAERLYPDEGDEAGEAGGDAAGAPRVEGLVGDEEMRQGHCGHRHDAHENGRQGAVDVNLAPADERERQGVAEQADEQKDSPRLSIEWDPLAAGQRVGRQQHGGDGQACRRQRHRRDGGDGDLDEHERRAPDGRQQDQQKVIAPGAVRA